MAFDSNRRPSRGGSDQELWPKWMWVAAPVLVIVVVGGALVGDILPLKRGCVDGYTDAHVECDSRPANASAYGAADDGGCVSRSYAGRSAYAYYHAASPAYHTTDSRADIRHGRQPGHRRQCQGHWYRSGRTKHAFRCRQWARAHQDAARGDGSRDHRRFQGSQWLYLVGSARRRGHYRLGRFRVANQAIGYRHLTTDLFVRRCFL